MNDRFAPVTMSYDSDTIEILDQTRLPGEVSYISLRTEQDVWEAICSLKVRGAPSIGITAAFGMCILTKNIASGFFSEFKRIKEYLATSRPTAVNLFWALDRMEKCLEKHRHKDLRYIKRMLRKEAETILCEDRETCRRIGENALALLKPGMGILTHCNAGRLATAGYGTALAPVYLGNERGYNFRIYAGETRPLMQGSRLTAWELTEASSDVTLVCDNAVSSVMAKGLIDAVLVGCDRVAANGDTANKTGTGGIAVIARSYGIPFYVCCPLSSVDLGSHSGGDIVIEERNGEEIYRMWFEKDMAPAGIKTYNPAFDITRNEYISAIISEEGIIYPPYTANIIKAASNASPSAHEGSDSGG